MRAVEIKKSEIETTLPKTTTSYGLSGTTGMESYPTTWSTSQVYDVEPMMNYTQPIDRRDIVISGVSGRFPEVESVEELSRRLFNGNEVYGDVYGMTKRFQQLNVSNNFDNVFFGIHEREVQVMDPRLKVLLQVTYEAIFDSGFNPVELKGTNTGVFIGSTGINVYEPEELVGFNSLPTGSKMSTTMIANQLLKYFNFTGPATWVDTTNTNSLITLDNAINAINMGTCDQAIVAGIVGDMDEKKMYEKYGSILPEHTKVSFVNYESVSVIFLRRHEGSRRFYAKVKFNTKYAQPKTYECASTYFTTETMGKILRDTYEMQKVNPRDVTYVEVDGVRPITNDFNIREVEPIVGFFTKTRSTPLYIGSTMPFVGYTAPTSGIISLVKMIVAIQKGMIPVRGVKSFVNGRLEIVEPNTRFNFGYMALNSIGMNTLCHIVLEPHFEWMMTKFQPQSVWNKDLTYINRQPRLFTFSGRSEEEINNMFEQVHKYPTDLATHALLNSHANTIPQTHPYRGFTVLNTPRQVREITKCITEKKPIWYVFSGMGSHWSGMGKELMQIECFRKSIYESADYLKQFNIDLVHLILRGETERILYQSIIIPAIQIALVKCLTTLGITPNGFVGHSFGEVVAAYLDKCLTHEEVMLVSYYRGKYMEEANLPTGAMAIVNLPWEQLYNYCPSTVVPAYFNSSESVVVSGPKRVIVQLIEDLKLKGIFAKEIESSSIALHSYFLTPIVPKYREILNKVIRSNNRRSGAWLSTTFPAEKWNTNECLFPSAEYFLTNLMNPVYFSDAICHIPSNAVVIEISPRSILKKHFTKLHKANFTFFDLMRRESPSHIEYFWNNLGKLYNNGINFDIMNLMALNTSIYPVPSTTRFMTPLMRNVEYKRQMPVRSEYGMPSYMNGCPYPFGGEYTTYPIEYNYPVQYSSMPTQGVPTMVPRKYVTPVVSSEYQTELKYNKVIPYEIDLRNEYEFLNGHRIGGKIVYPMGGYLYLIWKTLANLRNVDMELLPVEFENIHVHRPTIITDKIVKFMVRFDEITGRFEIYDRNQVLVSSGRVFVSENISVEIPTEYKGKSLTNTELLTQEEIYNAFNLKGLNYTDLFKGITRSNIEGTCGEVMWTGKWIPFLESIFQMHIMGKYGLQLPTYIKSLCIDPRVQTTNMIRRDFNSNIYVPKYERTIDVPSYKPTPFYESKYSVLPFIYDPSTRKCFCGGVRLNGIYSTSLPKTCLNEKVVFERINFVPYFEKRGINDDYYVPEVEYRPEYEYIDTYLNECKHHLSKIINKLEGPYTMNTFTQMPQSFLESYISKELLEGKCTTGSFLRLLKKLSTIEKRDECMQVLKSMFKNPFQYYQAWHNDIFNTLNRDTYLKSCLDTVCENVQFDLTPKIKILEIAPAMNVFAPKVSSFLSTYPHMNVDYHYVPVGELSEEIFTELRSQTTFPINKIEWNFLSQAYPRIPTLKDFDLVIFNGSIGNLPFVADKIAFQNWLNTICETMLKRDGFLLFNEYVNHFETIKELKRLEFNLYNQELLNSEIYKCNQKYFTETEWRRLFEEYCGLHPISLKSDSILSTMFLYRRPFLVYPIEYQPIGLNTCEIKISSIDSFGWVERVKQSLNDQTIKRIWLICENAPTSGVIGLVNALRHEPRGECIRCVFIADTLGKPWRDDYNMIMKSDLVMNVYKNGKWGAYRMLRDMNEIETPFLSEPVVNNTRLNILKRGDLSTLTWTQVPVPVTTTTNEKVVKVCYAGLNYRDINFATGLTTTELYPRYTSPFNNTFGLEFSGYVNDKRYMGITSKHSLATTMVADLRHCWEIPTEWTLEQAATVPLSYACAYYSLFIKGGLKPYQTVLIHNGATPFGLAAAAVALQHNCYVYITVESEECKNYILSLNNRLTPSSIYNMSNPNTLEYIRNRGADVILNVANDNLVETFMKTVLNKYGRLIDVTGNEYNTPVYQNGIQDVCFHKVDFEPLFDVTSYEWGLVHKLVQEGILAGYVKPIESIVFERTYIKDAFNHLMYKKPINKVLIKLWEPKGFNCTYGGRKQLLETGFDVEQYPTTQKLVFSPYYTYIITNGLTPFGLELATFLVQRGVRKILMTTKYGITSGYHTKTLQYLQNVYGAIISVSNYELINEKECLSMIREAVELSEERRIGGVFQLEPFIDGEMSEFQSSEKFKSILERNYMSTMCLDKLTRNMDGYFVVFSPVFGQSVETLYTVSSIERLCELRRQDGKHALFFQWNKYTPIDQLKYFFDNEYTTNMPLTDSIMTCLNKLETILLQGNTSPSLWSCYVPRTIVPVQEQYLNKYETPMRTSRLLKNFFGYPTIYEYIQSVVPEVQKYKIRPSMTLIELGLQYPIIKMIKSFLEQTYNYPLTIKEVEQITLEKIRSIEQGLTTMGEWKSYREPRVETEWSTVVPKYNYLMPRKVLERLNTVELTSTLPVVVIHPIEGHVNMLKTWAKHMKYPVYGVQFTSEALRCESIESLADFYLQQLEKEFRTVTKFHLVGYSFGSSVAYEMAARRGEKIASLTFLDGNATYVHPEFNGLKYKFNYENVPETESECLYSFINQYTSIPNRMNFIQQLLALNSFEERIKYAAKELYTTSQFTFDPVDVELAARSYVSKIMMSYKYVPRMPLKLRQILSIRPTIRNNEVSDIFGGDYYMTELINDKLKVFPIEADRRSFLESTCAVKVASILNDYLMQYF